MSNHGKRAQQRDDPRLSQLSVTPVGGLMLSSRSLLAQGEVACVPAASVAEVPPQIWWRGSALLRMVARNVSSQERHGQLRSARQSST
eukprot:scaffold62755_cov35-Tisochrysis_lutea.AAC.3